MKMQLFVGFEYTLQTSPKTISAEFWTAKQLNITYRWHSQRLIVLLGFFYYYSATKICARLFDPFLSPPARLSCVPFRQPSLDTIARDDDLVYINACAPQRHTIVFDDDVERTNWEISNEGKCTEATGTTTSSYCCHWCCLCVVFTVAHHYTTFGLLFIAQIHCIIKCNRIVFKCLWAHTLTHNQNVTNRVKFTLCTLHARRIVYVWR